MSDPTWDGNEIAMIFDGVTGNAIDSFNYTADELERRARELRADAGELTTVTMEPSPFVVLWVNT